MKFGVVLFELWIEILEKVLSVRRQNQISPRFGLLHSAFLLKFCGGFFPSCTHRFIRANAVVIDKFNKFRNFAWNLNLGLVTDSKMRTQQNVSVIDEGTDAKI